MPDRIVFIEWLHNEISERVSGLCQSLSCVTEEVHVTHSA